MKENSNPVIDKSLKFSLMIIDFCEQLELQKKVCDC